MPVSITTLPGIPLDYTQRGPGLYPGMTRLFAALEGERKGHLRLFVKVPGAVVQVIMRRSDLYLVGFESGGTWWRFDDADWTELSPAAKPLGHDGSYRALGDLTGILDAGSIAAIAKLAQPGQRSSWKPALRTLLVVVAECARLVPVQMHVLGLLNGIDHAIALAPLAHYIQGWSAASRGADMSRQVNERLRVGFRDPTIIRKQ